MATLPDLPQTERAIVEMTNAFRRESKLGEVKPNAALTAAARAFAEYLARTGKFAHEADGRQPAQRAEASGYRYCRVAENLAMTSTAAVSKPWRSPARRSRAGRTRPTTAPTCCSGR